jgi:GNAT superfamily N-acetyltransferase
MAAIVRHWQDFAELQRIEQRASERYREIGYEALGWSDEFPESFARHEANGLLWVATVDGRAAGFAVADLFRDVLHLEELDVDPSHQRRGLGTLLVGAVIDEARARLLGAVTLRTFLTTPWSVGLYEKCGFRTVEPAREPAHLAPHRARERAMGLRRNERCTMILELRARPGS